MKNSSYTERNQVVRDRIESILDENTLMLSNKRDNTREIYGNGSDELRSASSKLNSAKNVLDAVKLFDSWDFKSLFKRMENTSLSLDTSEQNRFDAEAIKIGDAVSASGQFKQTKQAIKEITASLWEEAKETQDLSQKRIIIQHADEISKYKGNDILVLLDSYLLKQNKMIHDSLHTNNMDSSHDFVLNQLSVTQNIIRDKKPDMFDYQFKEQKSWDNILSGKNDSRDWSVEKIDRETRGQAIQAIQGMEVKDAKQYEQGVSQAIFSLEKVKNKDMQSILDVLSARAYRSNDNDFREGVLDAVAEATPFAPDVQSKKTKSYIVDFRKAIEGSTETAEVKEMANIALDEFKGNDVGAFYNKSAAIYMAKPLGGDEVGTMLETGQSDSHKLMFRILYNHQEEVEQKLHHLAELDI